MRTVVQQDAAADRLTRVHRVQRSCRGDVVGMDHDFEITRRHFLHAALEHDAPAVDEHDVGQHVLDLFDLMRDRKSTRLNSSHSQISYAVFCLKKKKKKKHKTTLNSN